jgi:hypothetical protein
VLTFRYRALKAWRADVLARVHELLILYFTRIGGFCIARDATIRTWYEALEIFSADELGAAIESKARSLEAATPAQRRERRRFVAHPQQFVRVAGYWLTESPQYRARRQARQAAEERARAPALSGIVRGIDRGERSGLGMDEPDRVAQLAVLRAAAAKRWALWGALAAEQRAAALAAVRPRFLERCREWGERPDAPHLAAVLTSMASSWALRQWATGGRPGPLPPPAVPCGRFDGRLNGLFPAFWNRTRPA